MSSALKQNCFEKDFENLFNFCRKKEMSSDDIRDILKSVIYKNRIRSHKNLILCLAILIVMGIIFAWIEYEYIPGFLAAVGRLLLIKILPVWDWTPLYNSVCVIDRISHKAEKPFLSSSGYFETDSTNCLLCKTLDGIPTTVSVNYSYIEEKYLERGLPVIITTSHDPVSLMQFLQLMASNTSEFLGSEPCDLATNLMLKKLFTVQLALQKMQSLHSSEKWFLQLRNCQFGAVKSSRHFVTRPYYYPFHLKPFYSSWVLIANNYAGLEQEIELLGLIFVQQISGFFNFYLKPKRPCARSCPTMNIRLHAGESLVFSTDIWVLSYGTGPVDSPAPTSIATILEIDWTL